MPICHSSVDVEKAIGYMNLKFKAEVGARDRFRGCHFLHDIESDETKRKC